MGNDFSKTANSTTSFHNIGPKTAIPSPSPGSIAGAPAESSPPVPDRARDQRPAPVAKTTHGRGTK
jgi:hypothetical protein